MLLVDYFQQWVELYKKGFVRKVTLDKYDITRKSLIKICPDLRVEELTKTKYQWIINQYAETHAKQTVRDFHRQIAGCVVELVDEGVLKINPCKKAVIKGNKPSNRKEKYLSLHEVEKLISKLNLNIPIKTGRRHLRSFRVIYELNYDWLIYLALKTGLRFGELLGLTKNDFDFEELTISVNKVFDYKHTFQLENRAKTRSSLRTIAINQELADIFKRLLTNYREDEQIFFIHGQRMFNSTVNNRLNKLCKAAKITPISIHGLRHTHASILLYKGISIHSISKRLGHSEVSTTQDVYAHIIDELQQKDNELIRNVI